MLEPDRLIDLSGQTALVSGGSRGIGAACSLMLARAGCNVALNYRRRADAASRVVERITALGRAAIALPADVADPQQVAAMVAQAVETFGGLQIVVANAGIWTDGRIESMTDADWSRMIAVNLSGAFHLVRSCVPWMRRSGGGSICLISSTAGQRGEAEHSHYAASKGGLIAFARSLAVELAPAIRVNVVAPGWIRTDMTEPFCAPTPSRNRSRSRFPWAVRGKPRTWPVRRFSSLPTSRGTSPGR